MTKQEKLEMRVLALSEAVTHVRHSAADVRDDELAADVAVLLVAYGRVRDRVLGDGR